MDKFVQFVKFVEIQTGRRIKVLRSDNGGEYVSNKFAAFCREQRTRPSSTEWPSE